jgi:hypothetical protein
MNTFAQSTLPNAYNIHWYKHGGQKMFIFTFNVGHYNYVVDGSVVSKTNVRPLWRLITVGGQQWD